MNQFADFDDAADRGVSLSFLEKLAVKQNLEGVLLSAFDGGVGC